jgi:hypothetical protein
VAKGLAAFAARHRPDELMVVANIHDPQARQESYRIAAQAWGLQAPA